LASLFEESAVQGGGDPLHPESGIDSYEVDVRHRWVALREEADEEGGQLTIRALEQIAGRREVLKVQPRQQKNPLLGSSVATQPTPPTIQQRMHARMVVFLRVTEGHPGGKLDRHLDAPSAVKESEPAGGGGPDQSRAIS